MSLQAVAQTLDPADFVVAPHIACLDTFRMTDESGGFVTEITPEYLDRFVAHMNERELATGDLAPIVIGHTINGLPETEQPPVVGFARNWTRGVLGNTNRECAFADFWIKKQCVDEARNFPRRSCEVWASRYEADPISLLGATTPARDLGLMKLSREGSITFYPPGDMNMPEDKDKKPKADEKPADKKETGSAKKDEGEQSQILALLTQILEAVTGGAGAAGAAPAGAPAAPAAPGAAPGPEGAPGAGGEMSDDEYNKLLQELMAEPQDTASRKEEPEPVKNMGQPGNTNTTVAKCSREEQEQKDKIAALETEVASMRIKDKLVKLQREGKDVNPEDTALIADLAAMPADMRDRQIDRMAQFNRQAPDRTSFHLDSAVAAASPAQPGKRIQNVEERNQLIKLSREKGMTFEAYLRAEGYAV